MTRIPRQSACTFVAGVIDPPWMTGSAREYGAMSDGGVHRAQAPHRSAARDAKADKPEPVKAPAGGDEMAGMGVWAA